MRLFEFEVDPKTAVMNALNYFSASMKDADVPAVVNMEALSKFLEHQGISMNYDAFKVLYDNTPQIQKMVQDFNPQQITISDGEDDDNDEDMGLDADTENPDMDQDLGLGPNDLAGGDTSAGASDIDGGMGGIETGAPTTPGLPHASPASGNRRVPQMAKSAVNRRLK